MDSAERYSRQTMLPELGAEGQKRLSATRILLVGAGGLGSPIATYLTAAGIGTLGIIDADKVSVSNLQRQTLYTEDEVGQSKVECAYKRLHGLNHEVSIRTYDCFLTKDNAAVIIAGYDMVVDGCDNFATRFIINDICIAAGKPYIYGSIQGLNGQVSVFGVPDASGKVHSYRDLYDESELLSMEAPSKAVLGITPAVTGSVEANQVLQLAAGFGEPLIGKLWSIDLRTMESYIIDLP